MTAEQLPLSLEEELAQLPFGECCWICGELVRRYDRQAYSLEGAYIPLTLEECANLIRKRIAEKQRISHLPQWKREELTQAQ